jgi:hypothetical protein
MKFWEITRFPGKKLYFFVRFLEKHSVWKAVMDYQNFVEILMPRSPKLKNPKTGEKSIFFFFWNGRKSDFKGNQPLRGESLMSQKYFFSLLIEEWKEVSAGMCVGREKKLGNGNWYVKGEAPIIQKPGPNSTAFASARKTKLVRLITRRSGPETRRRHTMDILDTYRTNAIFRKFFQP